MLAKPPKQPSIVRRRKVSGPVVQRLVELMQRDGRMAKDIAARAGLDPKHLSQIVTGARPDPSVSTVARLLKAMDKTWTDLEPQ